MKVHHMIRINDLSLDTTEIIMIFNHYEFPWCRLTDLN